MLSRNFKFVEKDFVPYAIERLGGRVFRMCGRSMAKWEEIEDDDKAFRITSNASKVSESDVRVISIIDGLIFTVFEGNYLSLTFRK